MVHPKIVTYVRDTTVDDDVGLSDSHHPEQESAQARSGLPRRPLAPLAGGSNPLAEEAYRRLDGHFVSPGGAAFSMPRLPIGRPCNIVSLRVLPLPSSRGLISRPARYLHP
jgi:hypothetical protein